MKKLDQRGIAAGRTMQDRAPAALGLRLPMKTRSRETGQSPLPFPRERALLNPASMKGAKTPKDAPVGEYVL